jgi:hypothetical protein
MRLNLGSTMVVVRSPGGRRSYASIEVLPGKTMVNVVNSTESGIRKEKRLGRASTLP